MKTIRIILKNACVVFCICGILSACNRESSVLEDGDEFIFPTQQNLDGPRVVMEALLIGELVQEGKSLRIQAREGGTHYVVIWPPDYAFRVRSGRIEVVDEEGKMRVKVGEQVFVSGGETHTVRGIAVVSEEWQQELSTHDGPYWMVGAEVHLVANVPEQFRMWID